MTATKTMTLMALLLLSTTAAFAEGRCFTAEIEETIVLPDGSEHAPGSLRICTDPAISPASSLHRTFIDGQPVARLLSRPREIEDRVAAGAARFVFVRGARDGLSLVGYAVGGRGRTTLYEMSGDTERERVILVAAAGVGR